MIAIGSVISKITDEIKIKEKIRQFIAVLLVSICFVSVTVDATIEYHICSYNFGIQTNVEDIAKTLVKRGQKDIVLTGEYNIIAGGRYNIYNRNLGIPLGVFDYPALDGSFLEKVVNTFMAAYFGADSFSSNAHINYIDY